MPTPKHDSLIKQVQKTIKQYAMFSTGDHIVVAVSGGPDSVCLLHVLHILSEAYNFTLHIAHLDHMFRGKESADEAAFVADLAKKFSLPSTIEQIDVPAFCREHNLSAQEGARKIRYDFLQKTAVRVNASCIATGHTMNDQAETFIMRMVRGSGVTGLSGIPAVRDNIVRPLIHVSRQAILAHLKKNNLSYATDSSNAKSLYARNRIRMEILPLLSKFNPRIVETLASVATVLRDEDEAMQTSLMNHKKNVIIQMENAIVLKRTEFNELPLAFKRRLLRDAITRSQLIFLNSSRSHELSVMQINTALEFMASAQTGRALHLPGGLRVEREYDRFMIFYPSPVADFTVSLTVPGITQISKLGVQVETKIIQTACSEEQNYPWHAEFDYDKMQLPLHLRNRRTGDWFCPAGMEEKHKKIQDFFVDVKIPRYMRDQIPLLVSGESIVWVVGHRLDHRFLPDAKTKQRVCIWIKNNN